MRGAEQCNRGLTQTPTQTTPGAEVGIWSGEARKATAPVTISTKCTRKCSLIFQPNLQVQEALSLNSGIPISEVGRFLIKICQFLFFAVFSTDTAQKPARFPRQHSAWSEPLRSIDTKIKQMV